MKKLILFIIVTVSIAQAVIAQTTPKVYTKGAMNNMGPTYDIKVWLDTIPDKSHLFAMGPYDKMKGEITVFDGKPFYASAFEEGKAVVSQSWDIRSPFFVYSNVKNWEKFDLIGPLNSIQEIQEKVGTIAKSQGYNLNKPFAFRIAGKFDQMTTHIVTPRSPDVEGYRNGIKSQNFSLNNDKGEILGFYSEQHQGVFTGSKSFIHVHYLRDD
ncbi:acetolactate decarboxylase, partial [Zobellia laminariae]|uniref:acetolactate decarboxylase n=1 Tax=Zobellia laminariae TaxID=248906 RepID=UPI003EF9E28D